MTKLIFELIASDVNVAVELQKQRDLVKQLNKEYKASTAPDEQKRLINELAKAKVAISDLTKEQQKLNKEFKATQVPSDSIAGLRLEYSKLTAQINNLSKAERESDLGKSIVNKAAGLKKEISSVEQSLGNFTGNVGNYKSALSGVGDILTGGLVTGGPVAAIGAVVAIMQVGITTALDYEQALSDLSALTGKTGADLQGLEDVATSLETIKINGVEVVSTGTDILNALKLVGGAKPDLLENADALGEVTRQAIILSKASGDTLENSVTALTTVLGQFNLEGEESARVINELAAGAKFGSSEIPQTTEALQKFGAIAKISNISTSESIALTELLATKQLKGAEAGTALKTVLARLASAEILPKEAQDAFKRLGIDAEVLKDQTIPLGERLKELGKATGDVSALTAIFGVDQLAAATIITDGVPVYEQLTKDIYGTSEAYTAAAIRSDTATVAFENLKNKGLNLLQKSFSLTLPILTGLVDGFSFLIDKVGLLAFYNPAIAAAVSGISSLWEILGLGSKKAVKDFKLTNDEFEKIAFGKTLSTKGDPILEGLKKRTADAKALSDALADSTPVNSLAALQTKLKGLKNDFESAEIGSEKFKKLSAQINATENQINKITGKGSGKKPAVTEAAAGSLDALQKKVSDLRASLESATPDQIPRILGNLTEAETKLKAMEASIEGIRKPETQAQLQKRSEEDAAAQLGLLTPSKAKELTDANKEAAVEFSDFVTENQEMTDDQVLQLQRDLSDKKIGLTKEELAERTKLELDAEKEKEEKKKAIQGAALDSIAAITGAIADAQKQKIDEEETAKLSALDEQYAKDKELAAGNAAQLLKIDKEYQKKKDIIEKEAARERKRIALIEATIQGAIAVVKGFATGGPVGALIAGIGAATQIAIIASQKFAVGGFTGKGGAKDSTGERVVNAQLHEGEYVMPRAQVEQYPQLANWLDQNRPKRGGSRGFGMAVGGFSTAPAVTFSSAQAQATQGVNVTASAVIDESSAQMIARLVAEAVYSATSSGISDADRTNERKQTLETFTNV